MYIKRMIKAVFPLFLLLSCGESGVPGTHDMGGSLTPDLPPIPVQDSGNADFQKITPGPDVEILELTATPVVKFPTVVKLSWKTKSSTSGAASFGLTPGLELATVASTAQGTTHSVLLKGIPAATKVHYQVSVKLADSTGYRAEGSYQTASLPASLPQLTLNTRLEGKAAGGYTAAALLQTSATWLVILDGHGRTVWYFKSDDEVRSAKISMDRQAVLAMSDSSSTADYGDILRIPFDGGPTVEIEAKGSFLAFDEIEPGKYAYISREVRTFSGGTRKLLGESIVEVSPGAKPKVVWSLFDHVQPDLNQTYPKNQYSADPDVEDWSHINYITYDPGERAYLVTARELSAVIKVSRDTGKTLWIMGSPKGTIDMNGDNSLVSHPHSVQLTNKSVLVFNNGPLSTGTCSSVVETGLTETKAAKLWSYIPSPCHHIIYLGQALRLWNGNTLVAWSTAGRLEELTPAKELAWSVHAALGTGIGFVHRVKSLY